MIAESYAEYRAGRTYVYNVARKLDLSSFGNTLDADGVKLFCAPAVKRIADRAIQVSSWQLVQGSGLMRTDVVLCLLSSGMYRCWVEMGSQLNIL